MGAPAVGTPRLMGCRPLMGSSHGHDSFRHNRRGLYLHGIHKPLPSSCQEWRTNIEMVPSTSAGRNIIDPMRMVSRHSMASFCEG